MRNIKHTILRMSGAGLLAGTLTISLAACSGKTAAATSNLQAQEAAQVVETEAIAQSSTASAVVTTANYGEAGAIDTTDLFTERDLTQSVDTTNATVITLQSGQDVQINQEGTYVITGEAANATIIVEADDAAKVQLVLSGVNISNDDFPAIYVKSADKVFVTTAEGTSNVLQVTGSFVADGDTNTDAVIFSKDDLTLNGLGSLTIVSTANGVTSKDDLKVTGGSYALNAAADALEANDSIRIADGTFDITATKDALHAENDEDDTLGYIYVCGGTFNINAGDDGMQATTVLQIDNGSFTIDAVEALEATYVQVNGGTIGITASDDGINATTKSSSLGTPTIEIRGGDITVNMGAGDTDAIDANGNVVMSGGNLDITAQSAFDFDGTSSFTGGTITVNGEQITEITNSMMMGGGPMGGGMGGGPMGGGMGGGPMGGPGM